jgi:hypothetical protein
MLPENQAGTDERSPHVTRVNSTRRSGVPDAVEVA